MEKIAIYYRVSTDKQDLASQTHAVEQWLKQHPKPPKEVHIFKDEAMSGKNSARPSFLEMLSKAHRHEIDTIVVYRLDRFSRDANTAIRSILELDQHGVAFVSVSQPMLNLGHDVPFRRTILAAFAEIAELERETIVDRVKAGLAAAKKRGTRLGAPVKADSDAHSQAALLRAQGLTIAQISERLELSVGTVHKLLKKTSKDRAEASVPVE
jgi:DNA invertase Pin-like site-specific DNA recombinase